MNVQARMRDYTRSSPLGCGLVILWRVLVTWIKAHSVEILLRQVAVQDRDFALNCDHVSFHVYLLAVLLVTP